MLLMNATHPKSHTWSSIDSFLVRLSCRVMLNAESESVFLLRKDDILHMAVISFLVQIILVFDRIFPSCVMDYFLELVLQ